MPLFHKCYRYWSPAARRISEGNNARNRTLHAKQVLTEAGVSEAHGGTVMIRDALADSVATKTDIAKLDARIFRLESNLFRFVTP